jgi:hypothetical protein
MAEDTFNHSRRAFNAQALALGAAALAGTAPLAQAAEGSDSKKRARWQERLAKSKRLFCIAYIAPENPSHAGQEATVARFPLAVVPQGSRTIAREWRATVREANPDIVMLGYQMTIEETTVPGPGHDIMRKVVDGWTSLPDGSTYTIPVGSPDKMRRVYDPRKRAWRDGFLDACQETIASDQFEGLFLDQCTVYNGASPDRAVREEMKAALQETLMELRRREPNALIIANSSFTFTGVNGELNEDRPRDYPAELTPTDTHADPRVELAHVLIKSSQDREGLKSRLLAAREYGAFFGASRDYQHVEWYPEFDTPLVLPKAPSKPNFET